MPLSCKILFWGMALGGRLGEMCGGPQKAIHDNLSKRHIILILLMFNSKCDCWSYYKMFALCLKIVQYWYCNFFSTMQLFSYCVVNKAYFSISYPTNRPRGGLFIGNLNDVRR